MYIDNTEVTDNTVSVAYSGSTASVVIAGNIATAEGARDLIEAGADAVLVSHNIVQCMDPELPASLSPEVHRVLREDLGFEGVVLTDDLTMGAITQFTDGRSAAVQAVLAGNDLICCSDYAESAAAIAEAVRLSREAGMTDETFRAYLLQKLKLCRYKLEQ